jgi:uncharacterized membrane protein (UPF0127 family)
MQKRRSFIIFLVLALAILLCLTYALRRADRKSTPSAQNKLDYTEGILRSGGAAVNIALADTPGERILGLSGQESLGAGEGLLFEFPESERHGIWMRDMNFAIDIVWLDRELRVVDIKEDARPTSFRSENDAVIFKPRVRALYVLELPSGFAREGGIRVGDKFLLELKNEEK